MIHPLAENVTATGAQASVHTFRHEATEGIVQVTMTSGTVVLEGAMLPAGPWVTIDTFTASGGKIVAIFPEMRVNLTTGVGVTVRIAEPSP